MKKNQKSFFSQLEPQKDLSPRYRPPKGKEEVYRISIRNSKNHSEEMTRSYEKSKRAVNEVQKGGMCPRWQSINPTCSSSTRARSRSRSN